MSKKTIKDQVEKRAASTNTNTPESEPAKIDNNFIRQCLGNNVMGDAELFAPVCRGRFLFNGNSGSPMSNKSQWYVWNEHYWKEDVANSIMAAIGYDVTDKYEDLADSISLEVKQLEAMEDKSESAIKRKKGEWTKVNKRIYDLKGDRAKKVLGWVPAVASDMVVAGEDLDRHNHLIACNNGVINLETGECLPGDPADKITRFTPHDWPGLDVKPKVLIDYLRCSLAAPYDYQGDKDKFINDRFEFFCRFIGAAAHGEQRERAFMILYGEHGWNGKGLLMGALLDAMGDYAAPMAPAVLLKSNSDDDPSKPTPHIIDMKGRRFLFASEVDEGKKFSPAKVKDYSGPEKKRGRRPHDIAPTDFDPTHTMFLLLNDLPYTKADDRAFWGRTNILRFHWSYVDNPIEPFEKQRDPSLESKLKKEAPEILAFIVQCYHKYLAEGGLNPPEEMIREKEAYRFREDTLGQFIEACCVNDPDKTQATPFKEIKEAFDPWFKEFITGSDKKMSSKALGILLSKKFKKISTSDNLPAYVGIQIKQKSIYLDDK